MNLKIFFHIKTLLELSKIKITGAVTITTFTGYVLANRQIDAGFIWPTIGIFLLACGSSVINQIQEKKYDALMPRTKNRPLPSGRTSVLVATIIAVVYVILGASALLFFSNLLALSLGLATLLWYNLVYVFLKRVTSLAVLPGSLIGAIPPLVGWVHVKESLLEFPVLIISLFFFFWQIPHFFLLVYHYKEDYKKGGYPVISDYITERGFTILIFFLFIFSACTALLLPFLNITSSSFTTIGIVIASSLFIVIAIILTFITKKEKIWINFFKLINGYILVVILFLVFDVFV